ncbi:hypothetical protein BGZ61DRAFT_427508 [Ilyonectria robusta]|uniref:uncharacterized protein n=1 Tax=Ilyonectria robusta TaxID=1079257 RepID=UPI001E8EED41|nr:uncharacterized protein BGZ61DRAFT_427508 [Ilyonectria robusta]KAH8672931.1 hypothetical protein BGZ61DRAFT_427508 [Ilyonectria robusta]
MEKENEQAAVPVAVAGRSTSPGDTHRTRRRRLSSQLEAARTSTACHVCRDKKVKCSGSWPCRYCSKRRLNCVFSASEKRKMYPVAQIEQLQQKVAGYESQPPVEGSSHNQPSPDQGQQGGHENPPSSRTVAISPNSDSRLATRTVETPHSETSAFSLLTQRVANEDQPSGSTSAPSNCAPKAILPGPSLSSSEIFGTEIRTLLLARSSGRSDKSTPISAAVASPHLDRELINNVHGWPSEEEANQLLELVILNVGISQHLFDIRSFSDNLARLYHDTGNETPLRGLWFVQVLFVLALGRLLRAGTDDDLEVPGVAFFNEAMRHMPAMSDVGKHGILGIEVVGLAALFLQVADRKDEAYLYASIALRLAISNGMHKANQNQTYSRSDSVHRSRLWWSLYMQERRLAAAGGHPMAIADEAISISPPADVSGFSSAAAIRVNVRAARITGRITSTIYVQNTDSEASFIRDVESILHSLHDIESTMPAEYSINFSPTGLLVAGRPFAEADTAYARTSSSLYLSVYQAVIHTVRPILLYMARNVRERDAEPTTNLTPTLRRLAEICVEAARKSLAILQMLRNTELIAKNAFLDLDILFSVGFIFVLVEAIHPDTNLGLGGIEGSRHVLQYLVTVGNRAAAKRLAELDQMCIHLRPSQDQPHIGQDLPYATTTQPFSFDPDGNTGAFVPGAIPSSNNQSRQLGDIPAPPVGETEGASLGMAEGAMENMLHGNADLASISLEGDNALYWVYHTPGFVYTGAELADWEALEF